MNKTVLKSYIELCKPRVVMLMILTSIVGMCLAPSSTFSFSTFVLGNLGIALVASAAAAINHAADQQIDKLMGRTLHRPLVQGIVSTKSCLWFAGILCVSGMLILLVWVNELTAGLTFLSLIGYAVFYTFFLKYTTPQNIVIGGIAGAFPPLLGWTAMTGSVSAESLLLVLIIFIWTPPHFWALAIYRLDDYAKANIPMLPHTHDVQYTKLNIVLYTILLICATCLPYLTHMSGLIYLIGIMIANVVFLFHVLQLYSSDDKILAYKTFKFSIHYLGILFLLLLIDHYMILGG